ncbi:hypothetical protein M426DRAFT_6662 [Hypoxylon sp. CI-4A]|nr:hypothetical protein M426DRAFT_6662 [Hypoxylon sp. CI-4A]
MKIPSLQYMFDKNNPRTSVLRLARYLFIDTTPQDEHVEITALTQGSTNALFKVRHCGHGREPIADKGDAEVALVKVYGDGTDLTIDRNKEIAFHKTLHEHGLAPQLLVRFTNGHAYQYLPGKACTVDSIGIENIWRTVATELARWHSLLPVEDRSGSQKLGRAEPNEWSTARKWLEAIPAETQQEKNRKGELEADLEYLARKLLPGDDTYDSQARPIPHDPLVFGHGDLVCGNIIVQTVSNSPIHGNVAVRFIDYEHSTYCSRAFELANHFSEWAGFECEYSKMPTTRIRREFIREYLRACHEITNNPDQVNQISEASRAGSLEAEVSSLMAEVDRYRGFPGFYWGLCALIQAKSSTGAIDFDYAGYADKRFAEFTAWREVEDGKGKDLDNLPFRELMWARP